MIKSIEIENFKCFSSYTKICFHEGINIICGRGGSGKTAFIQAFLWCINQYPGNQHFQDQDMTLCNYQILHEAKFGEHLKTEVRVFLEFRGDLVEIFKHQEYEKRSHLVIVDVNWSCNINGKKCLYPDLLIKYLFDPNQSLLWHVESDCIADPYIVRHLLQSTNTDAVLEHADRIYHRIVGSNRGNKIIYRNNHIMFDDDDSPSESDKILILLCIWYVRTKHFEAERVLTVFIDNIFSRLDYRTISKIKPLFSRSRQVIILTFPHDAVEISNTSPIATLDNNL